LDGIKFALMDKGVLSLSSKPPEHLEDASFASKSLVIGGLRGVAEMSEGMHERLCSLCLKFRKCTWIIVISPKERNRPVCSTKGKEKSSPLIMDPEVVLLEEDTHSQSYPAKIPLIGWYSGRDHDNYKPYKYAPYRNQYLREWYKRGGSDYLLLVDFDLLDLGDISKAIRRKEESNSAVLCLNGRSDFGYHRDTFATILSDGYCLFDDSQPDSTNAMVRHGNSQGFVEALSCFGGAAIYDGKFLKSALENEVQYAPEVRLCELARRYMNENERILAKMLKPHEPVCEHIPFHLGILQAPETKKAGAGIRIDLQWMGVYGADMWFPAKVLEHSHRGN